MRDIPDEGGIPGAYSRQYNRMMRAWEEDDARQEIMQEGRETMPYKGMAEILREEGHLFDAFVSAIKHIAKTDELYYKMKTNPTEVAEKAGEFFEDELERLTKEADKMEKRT